MEQEVWSWGKSSLPDHDKGWKENPQQIIKVEHKKSNWIQFHIEITRTTKVHDQDSIKE